MSSAAYSSGATAHDIVYMQSLMRYLLSPHTLAGDAELETQLSGLADIAKNTLQAESYCILLATSHYEDLFFCPGTPIYSAYRETCLEPLLMLAEGERVRYLRETIIAHSNTSLPLQVTHEIASLKANSYMRLPLTIGKTPRGLVVFFSQREEAFENEQLAVAETFARLFSTTIENRLFYSHYQMNRAVEQAFIRMAHLLSTEPPISGIMAEVVQQAMVITQAGSATVMLLEEDGHRLKMAAHAGNTLLKRDSESLEVKTGFIGQIVNQHHATVFQDVSTYPHTFPEVLELISVGTLIGVPLVDDHELIGVLLVSQSNDLARRRAFNERDLEALEMLAPLAASAIQKTRSQETMRKERSKLQAVLDHIHVPVFLVDKQGQLVLANPEAHNVAKRLNLPLYQSIGEPLTHLLANFPEGLLRLDEMRVGEPINLDFGEAGEFILQIAELPGEDNGGVEGYLFVGQEVTEQRQLDRARSELLHVLSHDLGNILMLALGPVALAVEENMPPEDYPAILNKVYRALNRAKTLIRDVIEIERFKNMGQTISKPYAIDTLLSEVVTQQQEAAREKQQALRFETEGLPTPTTLIGNPSLIKQALENIISNAIKYTPEGGEVRVCLRTQPGQVVIDISDTGYGIPASEIPYIWKRFYRVKNRKTAHISGTGMGLNLVRSVIQSHDGDIQVSSAIDEGSTFRVTLPFPR